MKKYTPLILAFIAVAAAVLAWRRSGEASALRREYAELVRGRAGIAVLPAAAGPAAAAEVASDPALEKLEADLGRLQPKPPVTGKVLALAAVGVALLGVGAFYFIRSSGRGTLVVTTDPPSGRIFIGDVGQGSREEINLIEPTDPAGLNFQWDRIEGLSGDLTQPYIGVNKRPVLDYPHSDGTAVIGGYV